MANSYPDVGPTKLPPPSLSSVSTRRSRSSSPRKPSESTYRARTLFRARIYVDAKAPQRTLAAKLQSQSMEWAATQAGEAEWAESIHEALNGLKSSHLVIARNRDWISDIKPIVHQPLIPQSSVPRKRLTEQNRPGESDSSRPGMNLESSSSFPSIQPAAAPTLRRDTALSVSSEQTPSTPFFLKDPRPDISLGLSDGTLATELHSAGVANADFLLNDLQDTGELISDPGVTPLSLRFPFLLVEAKSGATGGNLYQAQNQAAVGGASAVNIQKALFGAADGPQLETRGPQLGGSLSPMSLCFSVTTEGPVCELWAHFWDETKSSYGMANIGIWRTTQEDSAFDLISKISSILNWGSTAFQDDIVKSLML
ncbi:hypothetical protein BO82DRAFT_382947 [Aspergillus uvarum CBS 121591]|uniref:DUF7924 domain-containing protein n=1 Tax=Aspergillus uvarum CBS 121591 TaxID=1448315 RepID=A0A319CFG5_9EURO|nr:hypothetical protein BO82DRAFT_382947 [Aspergillus uvarum CBS 121591]PYH82451.1 hypothetical protein BO82DRAFT_382947 [Aspergillus uvarum CBS 121591]